MASFKAVNIESDDESVNEIDNTKEIQIEEALKLYQTALKLHSSEDTLRDAGAAYEELFKSAIFHFPESQSEYSRVAAIQDYQDEDVFEEKPIEEEISNVQSVTENAPSTLPQILHLSYKNRGEHHLDLVKPQRERVTSDEQPETSDRPGPSLGETSTHIRSALQDFAEALDKDEDDTDLWRRSARISEALNSQRTSRYCLESALEENGEHTDSVLSLPNFEAIHDRLELRKVHRALQDDSSRDSQSVTRERELPSAVRQTLDPYSFLAQSETQSAQHVAKDHNTSPARIILTISDQSLDAIGLAILNKLVEDQQGAGESLAGGSAISIKLENERVRSLSISKTAEHPAYDGIQAAAAESVMENVAQSHDEHDEGKQLPTRSPSVVQHRDITASPSMSKAELPLRKRSTEAANLPETPEGERTKSKRIRARRSTAADRSFTDGANADLALPQDAKHDYNLQADRWLFDLLRDIFRKMDVKMICNADQLRKVVSPNSPYGIGEGPNSVPLGQAMQDLYGAMQSWNTKKTNAFMRPSASSDPVLDTSNAGLLAFLDSSVAHTDRSKPSPLKAGAGDFVNWVNENWLTIDQVAIAWLYTMVAPAHTFAAPNSPPASPNHYLSSSWTAATKATIMQILLAVDEDLLRDLTSLEKDDAPTNHDAQPTAELVQTIFELHLEHFVQMLGPTSDTDAVPKSNQRSRLARWCDLARDHLVSHVEVAKTNLSSATISEGHIRNDPLVSRHLWAMVFSLKAMEEISREHLLLCIDDLKSRLSSQRKINLPNNRVMPELSPEAADKERSKCETMDFFLSIFDVQDQHPVDLIEKLEPILMPQASKTSRSQKPRKQLEDTQDHHSDSTESTAAADNRDSRHEILSEFLSRAKPALRLSLWSRLRDAYHEVKLTDKLLSVDFRIVRVVMAELQGDAFTNADAEERETLLLSWLDNLHKLVDRCYDAIESHTASLQCLQLEQLRETGATLIGLFTMLHTVALFDDFAASVQKGPPLTNPFRTYPSESFHSASICLHDMKLKTVILLYRVVQEASQQLPGRFPFPDIDRYEYLQYMHYELGVRRICKASDNLFLKFMHKELLLLTSQPITNDLAQILYDLYDLQCFSSGLEKQEHGCEPDYLDRDTALTLVDFVLERCQGISLKDLPKVDLGKSIEKLQNALGAVKSTSTIIRNRKIISAYLRSAVNPVDLFQSLKGIPLLSTLHVDMKDVPVASKGWYYLMGQINLAKYRRAKGQPVPTDDLDTAVSFLIHDLESDSDKWETWHRLAYANDSLVEEAVLWSAEKINSGRSELAQMQRASLHSYVQAVATAMRHAQISDETTQSLAKLYADFGNRVYASARPPFLMQAFSLKEFPERYFSGPAVGGGIYTKKPFKGLRLLQALRLSATLLRKSIKFSPTDWHHQYTLGKCLWKMHVYATEYHNLSHLELAEQALDEFGQALQALPARKDPARQEPILEPIIRIVFTLNKMVARHEMIPTEAADKITALFDDQKQFDVTKPPALDSPATWDDYMLAVLRILRTADRAKWHHRLHFKMAETIYNRHGQNDEAAKITRDFMAEEKLYSIKTLALTVWKPDNERPGRHWIYMTKYTRFACRIFEQAMDIEAMQLLARRVRKKTNEFYEHQHLWEEVSGAHLRLHRKSYSIPVHNDDVAFKNLTTDEFRPRAEALDNWLQSPETSLPLLDVLREVTELKKLNAGLAKPALFDDLIADTYAQIYKEYAHTLPTASAPPNNTTITTTTNGQTPSTHTNATATPEPQLPSSSTSIRTPDRSNVMALNNLMNLDGAADTIPPPPSPWRNKPLLTQPAEPAPKPRALRAPTRLQIIKRATEAAVAKVTAVQTSAGPAGWTKSGDNNNSVRVIIDNNRPRRKSDAAAAAAATAAPGGGERVGASRSNDGDNNENSEEDESQNDAANASGNDASSELSDVEVDEEGLDEAVPSSPIPVADDGDGDGGHDDDDDKLKVEDGEDGDGDDGGPIAASEQKGETGDGVKTAVHAFTANGGHGASAGSGSGNGNGDGQGVASADAHADDDDGHDMDVD